MTKETILSKIQKILALAEGAGTEAEGIAAMAMAQALLAKHNLSMSDVSGFDNSGEKIEQDDSIPVGVRATQWQSAIYNSIANLYFCDTFVRVKRNGGRTTSKTIVFIGKASNIEIAKSVASSIINLGESLAIEGGRNYGAAWKNSFKVGFAVRIGERAKEQIKAAIRGDVKDQTTGTALVIAPLYKQEQNAIAAYMKESKIELKKGPAYSCSNGGGFVAGRIAGNSASLHSNGIAQSNAKRIA